MSEPTLSTNRSERVASVKRRDGWYSLLMPGETEPRKFVSVTTVLNVINKPALVTWAAKTAASLVLEDPYKYSTAEAASSGIYGERDSAGARGTTIHSIAEALLVGSHVDTDKVPTGLRGHAKALEAFLAMHQPEPIMTEVTVYNTQYGYAGTLDLICKIGDSKVMMDWKTSKNGAIYPETALQLRAYRECDLLLIPARLGEPARLAPMGEVDYMAAVGLAEDGTFQFKQLEAPLDAFLAAKRLWEWQRGIS